MPTTITASTATELSTCVIQCDFEDEDGNAVAPETLTWSLMNLDGDIINEREEIEITDPESTEYITLTGDDLALDKSVDTDRVLLVEGTYDSAYGVGLYLRETCRFTISDTIGV